MVHSHGNSVFGENRPAWFNYHRIVFRARGRTARLIVSDWTSEDDSGGSARQETACNLVEVQPYLEGGR